MHLTLLILICLIEILVNISKADADKKRKIKAILMGLCIFLFAALRRESVGTDVLSYVLDYSRVINRSMAGVIAMNYRDPAFPILMKLLSYISNDPQILLIVIAAFEAISFSYLAYSFGEPFLFFILFITLRIYPFTLSALRQTIAMSLVWLGIPALKRRQFIKFIVLTVMASLFHSSAIISLLLIPLFVIDKTMVISCAALILGVFETVSGGVLVRVFNSFVFRDRYSGYVMRAEESGFSISTTFIIYLALLFLLLFCYRKLIEKDEFLPFYMRAISVGMMFSLIGQGFPNMFRIAYYFIIFLMAKTEDIVYALFTKDSRKLAIWIIVVLLIAQYIYLGPGAGTDGYRFFWQV